MIQQRRHTTLGLGRAHAALGLIAVGGLAAIGAAGCGSTVLESNAEKEPKSDAGDGSGVKPAGGTPTAPRDAGPLPSFWLAGYYNPCNKSLPVSSLALESVTELVHFSILPNADGTMGTTSTATCITAADSADVVNAAHAMNKRVLITVGGRESSRYFEPVIASGVRDTFISNLVAWVTSRGYDGVDIDMEPILATDVANYTAFVQGLRTALDAQKPGALITADVNWQPAMFAQLQGMIDRINYMTYNFSGAWKGWETWYNSPLSAGGKHFQDPQDLTKPLPAIDTSVPEWTTAGIQPAKLGIGVPFFGFIWTGATGPNQAITGVTTKKITYASLLDTLYTTQAYNWDATSGVPWLGITSPQSMFVSYDDEQSTAAKIAWAKQQGLGGVMLWDITQDWHNGAHPLVTAAAAAVAKL
jgi:chitinase